MNSHPLGGTQTDIIRQDGRKILRIEHGWECCPHEYIIVEKDPYAQEEKMDKLEDTPKHRINDDIKFSENVNLIDHRIHQKISELPDGELEIKFVPAPALPEITNIRRYRYRQGDRIVVRINDRIDQEMGHHVREIVALVLGVPSSSVLVLSQGSDIKVLRNTDASE